MGFWRDCSGRLTFDLPGVRSEEFPNLCRNIADTLDLSPVGNLAIGPDQMFWDFQRGENVIGLDWDIWMGFMVVAKSEASEALLQDVVVWLESNKN
jgi:hypothetical protein